jgi:hypothetical protein
VTQLHTAISSVESLTEILRASQLVEAQAFSYYKTLGNLDFVQRPRESAGPTERQRDKDWKGGGARSW